MIYFAQINPLLYTLHTHLNGTSTHLLVRAIKNILCLLCVITDEYFFLMKSVWCSMNELKKSVYI